MEKKDLYHATCTGPCFENVSSFLKYGGLSTKSDGCGQGPGLYLWTLESCAKNHALNFFGDESFPLIVVFHEEITPEKYEPDHEAHPEMMLRFIFTNFEDFKSMENFRVHPQRNRILIPKECKKYPETNCLSFVSEEYINKESSYKIKIVETLAIDDSDNHNIGTACLLDHIFKEFKKKFPEIIYEEMVKFLLDENTRAIKYVGKEPLIPVGLEIYLDKKWRKLL
ncbi:MAG: hypothetical protein QW051_02015 [Candidatus Aenigmatarchaeota archaeon]